MMVRVKFTVWWLRAINYATTSDSICLMVVMPLALEQMQGHLYQSWLDQDGANGSYHGWVAVGGPIVRACSDYRMVEGLLAFDLLAQSVLTGIR
jgi:hypothetical protein